ncbi:12649_t:CDS:2 [Acaulospora colombiana]|uniref:12649_t:CDS:1 n=1 Tax=Acaulospora colombiana TaxID=27376 RepID=A0ACA9NG42_9GLOM|nr:12649_t:CDS:2 [Acaulospora colombiana]
MITAVVEAFKATKNSDGGARMMEVFFNAKPKQSPSSADRSTWSWIVAVYLVHITDPISRVVYMTSSPDFLRATGFTQIYAIPYLAFILGYLFYNTGRNAQLFEPRREERGGKFVVEDSDEEDAMLPHSEAFELHGTIPHASESDD